MSAEIRERVALACRMVALDGYADLTLGHVSAREPGSRTVWIKRKGPALDEVEPDDVIPLDIDDADALDSPDYHLESVMHTEIYRVRPDVGSVLHGHPVYATALGAADAELLMLTHDAVLFAGGIGVFDDGPGLVTDRERGARVAAALGTHRAALLRNHGVVVAGEDVRWTVLAALVLERAIRFQAIAASLGTPRPMSRAEARAMLPQKYREVFMDEYWAAWVRRVERAGAPAPAAG